MTLWRKFVRWLAKKELAIDAALAEFDKTVSVSNQKLVSYLQGHHDGAKSIGRTATERSSGFGGFAGNEGEKTTLRTDRQIPFWACLLASNVWSAHGNAWIAVIWIVFGAAIYVFSMTEKKTN
jgi:hypothetical protein